MPEVNFYEYAIIRIVPRVEREEFFNVGVLLFSKSGKYLKAKIRLDENKLNCFHHELNTEELLANLESFKKICEGDHSQSAIAAEDAASRFRWLTAYRSSSIQTSRPHVGSATNLDETLERLFQENVN